MTATKPMPEQHARFIKAAHDLGCDEDKDHFEAKLGKIARHKPQKAISSRESAAAELDLTLAPKTKVLKPSSADH